MKRVNDEDLFKKPYPPNSNKKIAKIHHNKLHEENISNFASLQFGSDTSADKTSATPTTGPENKQFQFGFPDNMKKYPKSAMKAVKVQAKDKTTLKQTATIFPVRKRERDLKDKDFAKYFQDVVDKKEEEEEQKDEEESESDDEESEEDVDSDGAPDEELLEAELQIWTDLLKKNNTQDERLKYLESWHKSKEQLDKFTHPGLVSKYTVYYKNSRAKATFPAGSIIIPIDEYLIREVQTIRLTMRSLRDFMIEEEETPIATFEKYFVLVQRWVEPSVKVKWFVRYAPRNPSYDPPTRLETLSDYYSLPDKMMKRKHPEAKKYRKGCPYAIIAFCEDRFWTERAIEVPPGIPRPKNLPDVIPLAQRRPPPVDWSFEKPVTESVLRIPDEAYKLFALQLQEEMDKDQGNVSDDDEEGDENEKGEGYIINIS